MHFPSIYVWSAGAALIAVIGMLIAHRIVKPVNLQENQPALDATLNIVGTLVSILLGLLVAASLSNYQNLETAVDSEAMSISEVCRLAFGLPEKVRASLLQGCLNYCDHVVKDEWPAMKNNQTSPEVLENYVNVLKESIGFKPSNDGETNIQAALITSVQNWGNYRRQRLLWLDKSFDAHLMPVLLMCSSIVIIFAYLYVQRRSFLLHTFLICFVATALGANLGLIFMLSHPFNGDWAIQPKGFEIDSQLIRKYGHLP